MVVAVRRCEVRSARCDLGKLRLLAVARGIHDHFHEPRVYELMSL